MKLTLFSIADSQKWLKRKKDFIAMFLALKQSKKKDIWIIASRVWNAKKDWCLAYTTDQADFPAVAGRPAYSAL